MRAVLDTNVLVSAILSPDGTAAQILRLAKTGRVQLVFSPDTIREHLKVLRYSKIRKLLEKRSLPLDTVVGFLEQLTRISLPVPGNMKVKAVKEDPSDNIFLVCAVEGNAHYIISGDHHLKDLGAYQRIEILDPAAFLKIIGP